MSKLLRTIIFLTIFSIAMGFMESAIVIYLRELYYPLGFDFPLAPVRLTITYVEFAREAATIIMLLIIGIIAGRNLAERFSFFLFCFAVWDIFYYVFLYVVLKWPPSLFTWDILFFIPVPWVGPVLAPCIVSLTMIVLTMTVVYFHNKNQMVTISRIEWMLFILGSLIIIISFTLDFIQYMINSPYFNLMQTRDMRYFFNIACSYVPQTFNWWLFSLGEIFILSGIASMIGRHRKSNSKN
jgi:hypothetical protein